jgi:transglutaminase-like putative cysteine protease
MQQSHRAATQPCSACVVPDPRPPSRRAFVHSCLATAMAAGLGPAAGQPRRGGAQAPGSEHVAPTALIDCGHPAILKLADQLTAQAKTQREKAIRIHDAVRDRIRFGLDPRFYNMKASEVLASGVGFCNTKTTLFCALLRAQEIPTRVRFVDLSASVLRGLFSSGTDTVDHAISEVFIEGAWRSVDSYVVDKPLEAAARRLLQKEVASVGYGIHLAGQSDWDGLSSNFIQAVPAPAAPGHIVSELGYFEDAEDFYKRAPNPRNRLSVVNSLFIRFGAASINKNIDAVRSSA